MCSFLTHPTTCQQQVQSYLKKFAIGTGVVSILGFQKLQVELKARVAVHY